MRNFAKRVLFFIFFIAVLMTAVFFGFNLKTNPYKFAKGDQVVDTDGRYIMPGGQTIGVELKTEGVLVVGLADIINNENIKVIISVVMVLTF